MSRPRKETPAADANFAANLAAARKARGWTLEHLAQLATDRGAYIHPSAIWKSERGRKVTVGEAVALCDALEVALDVMLLPDQQFRVILTAQAAGHPEWRGSTDVGGVAMGEQK